ncbi:uncharacterized protein LOC128682872 [Plodia interpunctella]|uniref:uncharacterized protein LOC128682872 n=1 Tax=Plodia interpunctella TaxID=58824 RepID=UPI0023687FEA|nr:uncharacterized protein LOC128682872 [Plodia interpunctella]
MIRELSPELAKIAREELNEKPTQIEEDLRSLKEWIHKQPHLIARTDDQWLVGMLRGCKFSLERVKKKLDLYYTLKTTAPDITMRIRPTDPKFLDVLRLGVCIFLPKPKSQLYPRVLLIRAGAYDPEKNNAADIMCILYYLVQIVLMEDDVATVIGTRVLVDYQGVTMNHFTQGTPILKKMVAVSQDSMPLRLKGSHHMNMPAGIETILNLISTFLNEKTKERIRVHKSHQDLFEFLPKEIIPAEYGGDGGTITQISEYWVSKMIEYKSWMQQEEQLGTDESKRPGPLSGKNEFSTEGSFRKLDIFHKMTVRPLSAALLKKAQKEINENPKRVNSDIKALREWLDKQPHMHKIKPSDQWLLAFLRGSKFSLERSKEKLDMYYTLKGLVPEFFANRDPLDTGLQEMLRLGAFLPLKNCEGEDSCRTCIVKIGVLNSTQYNLSDMLKVAFMITEILMLEDDNFAVSGEQVIVDMKDVGVSILSQWTPALAKKVISCFEKALPVRMRSTHMLNTPTGFEAAYTIFKTFLGEKLKKRIQVHNQDYEAMHKSIPKSVLPVEYGGDDGSLQELIDYWKVKVESYRDWFIKEEKAITDEPKRPGKPKTSSELFGLEGSFRKLEVD